MRRFFNQTLRSKADIVLVFFLIFSAAISAGVAYAFYSLSLESFRTHKGEEKITALRLVDAFVTTYSSVRSQLGSNAPVPATFRAHSIESFNKQAGAHNEFLLRWVGRQGRQITTPPADAEMARLIEAFATQRNPKPKSTLSEVDGRLVFRTVYPSLAREQSCVSCHNQLQPDQPQWQLNDVMGAFAIDVPAASFLQTLRNQSYDIGLALFMALAAVGLTISLVHSRQMTERETAASELSKQNLRFDVALANMSQGLCMFDSEERLVVANDRYAEMYGLKLEQVKPGTPFRQIVEARIALGAYAGGDPQAYINERLAAVRERNASTKVQTLPGGRVLAISHQPMADGGWVATHEDITERCRIEERIAHMAHHDALTELPNRVLLRERLDQALAGVRHGEGALAVLLLDLDHFKEVNDTLGHATGDVLLKAVAERLRGCVRETDTVARLGGDEFAVAQVGAEQPRDATLLAERIIEAMDAPFEIDGHDLVTGTSVGIAIFPSDGSDADQLIKSADLALYRAKDRGRGLYKFFAPEMDARMQARRRLQLDLRKALANGEFELHYQPVVNLERDEVAGFEALLRWNHPECGRISPAEFIPVAEESGLIIPIGEWVLRHACAEAARWPEHLRVAVNLSPGQFKSRNLLETVFNALAAAAIEPHRLELEITESVLLQDADAALEILTRLRDFGVRVALDDFGTGYSSLSYLHRFPFDKIKIDRCFISGASGAAKDSIAILKTIAQLGRRLGMTTTAEGVETQEQLERARAEGCTEIQGYLFSPPRPARELTHFFFARIERDENAA